MWSLLAAALPVPPPPSICVGDRTITMSPWSTNAIHLLRIEQPGAEPAYHAQRTEDELWRSVIVLQGQRRVRDRANKIDGAGKRVRLKEGGWLNYDHLVIATGINMINPPSIDYKLTPTRGSPVARPIAWPRC